MHNKDLFVRKFVRSGDIILKDIRTGDNLADFFTKILALGPFRKHRDSIMGIK